MNKNPNIPNLADIFADDMGEESIKDVKLDVEKIQANISQYTNEKLCEMIVCDRYFGFEKKIAPMCMEELAKRRTAGDTFNFEEYIDRAYKDLPVLDLSGTPNVRSILHQAIGKKIGSR